MSDAQFSNSHLTDFRHGHLRMNSLGIEQSAELANCQGNLARCSAAKAQDESLPGAIAVETGKGPERKFLAHGSSCDFFIAVPRIQHCRQVHAGFIANGRES